jgi:hypothetical protein
MAEMENQRKYTFDSPGVYRIRIHGQLDDAWLDRLGAMEVLEKSSKEDKKVTALTGRLQDQAALAGVLDTLYGMQCTLISVELIETN